MENKGLKIHVDIPPSGLSCRSLAKYLQTIVDFLTHIDRALSETDTASVNWNVRHITMASPLIMELVPVAKRRPKKSAHKRPLPVVGTFIKGLRQIEESAKRPAYFDDDALDLAAQVVGFRRNQIVSRFSSEEEPQEISPTEHSIANVEAILGRHGRYYYAEMQLEGRLEEVSLHGTLTFSIYDPITERGTECDFTDDQLPEVIDLLRQRKRVRVTGRVKFNARHVPISVQVARFEALRDAKELPQIADLHAERIDITGGQDSADYVRELRDE